MTGSKEIIARRIAKEIRDGDVVNLGIGLPEMAASYIPEEYEVYLQSENGMLGMGELIFSGMYGSGERLSGAEADKNCINAGCRFVTAIPGSSFFDSATSFQLIRGGHVDVTVLGALQVDQEGNLASHIVPGKMAPGMGGAMDLVNGAKKVIVATTHMQKGKPKLKRKITLPATAINCVDMIVTEFCVITVEKEGFVLREIAEGLAVEELQNMTEAKLIAAKDLKTF